MTSCFILKRTTLVCPMLFYSLCVSVSPVSCLLIRAVISFPSSQPISSLPALVLSHLCLCVSVCLCLVFVVLLSTSSTPHLVIVDFVAPTEFFIFLACTFSLIKIKIFIPARLLDYLHLGPLHIHDITLLLVLKILSLEGLFWQLGCF